MNTRVILLPHMVFLIGAFFWVLAILAPGLLSRGAANAHRLHGTQKSLLRIAAFFIWIFIYPCLFLHLSEGWLKAEPTPGWREKAKSIDTAIILGFGFEKDAGGHLRGGRSNEFLLQWTLEHTRADTLLVQEGVLEAYISSDTRRKAPGKKLLRIHRHIEGIDMNTFRTAYCALEQMDALGKRQAVLVAHDLQLQRAAWIFEKLKLARPNGADLSFVVPEIPPTPFPADSDQLRTRWKLLYIFCELFGSRLRDYLSTAPTACLAPL